ncbi:hypothetical protein A6V36_31190 [Paraburkholderia ginsengiterrae]|uniref:Uncharacterized protein n=1 Tax=Paraburkholderia ginsengiterrae TaxID=1462993 RepID=A0A1A9MWH2_9BURK|nr:hypothetical protein A6V37_12065 [Paraburkholderia ginsengiterrae]OAJ57700.1 hypothetical protein A6V36_31190 [Paraburkholderia ginsengiterrae]
MKAILIRVPRVLGVFATWCVGVWTLGALISRSSFWIPIWLWNVIAAVIEASGREDLFDEDFIETTALTCLLVTCCVVVALAMRVVWILLARGTRTR